MGVAMGRTSPDYPDHPVSFAYPLLVCGWVVGGRNGAGWTEWRVYVPEGETLTVYAEEGEG